MKHYSIINKILIRQMLGAVLFLLVTANGGFGQTLKQRGGRELLPNQIVKRRLTGAESHRYKFDLNENEFFQVRVEQRCLDVSLKLFDAGGAELAKMDSPNSKEGPETLSFAAPRLSDYTLEVRGLDAKAEKGIYTIKREVGRTATAQDRRRVEVESVFVDGMTARDMKGQTETAIAKLEEALTGWRELADSYMAEMTAQQIKQLRQPKAKTLFDEAVMVLVDKGTVESYRAALEKFQSASRLYREIGDKLGEARSLVGEGTVLDNLGEKRAALKYFNQVLPLFQTISDKEWTSITLHNIGSVYDDLGEKQKALKFYDEALPLRRDVCNKYGEATTLNHIGGVYADLGKKQEALKFYNQSLPLFRTVKDKLGKRGEATTLNNIGSVYADLGKERKALKFYNRSLRLAHAIKDKSHEAVTLTNIGSIYGKSGKQQKALEFYNQSLPLFRADGNKTGESATLNNIGKVYEALDEKQKALDYYHQSLLLSRAVEDKIGEAITLKNAMRVWDSLNNPRLAIFYGKQCVNKYQELRQAIQGLDKETQKNYLETIEDAYRQLADILIAEGRLFEAQQVLELLKEDEYFGYVRRDPNEIKKLAARADLRADERAALEKYEMVAGKLTEYGKRFVKLEELREREGADFKQQAEYDDLKAKLDDANKAFRIFLDKELVAELGKPVIKEIENDRALQAKLRQWGNGTVALYTVAGEDRYRVILTTPKNQIDRKTDIKIADLNNKIFEFRVALQNPFDDPRPLGEELYRILIKPVEKDLIAADAKTLLWSLDGTLRYIPFAALSPDGKTYLAEKYQNLVVTSTTRQSLVAEVNSNWRLLGAGVTKESKLTEPNGTEEITFSALPGVEKELLKIISSEDAKTQETGLMPGRRLLDDSFNLTALENGMSQRVGDKDAKKPKYNVIHLATHFRLGGDTAKSFLLMGGNQALTLEKVSDDTALNFGDVELVTLSACNTGFGTTVENKAASRVQERKLLEENNGAEVDSLATFIELRGARAVLASLWAVADESTQLLMSEFYRLRKENPKLTKAEAMQIAQQAMIAGKLKPSGKTVGCRSDLIKLDGTQKEFKCDANAPFAHPYFWSPFVLIGNWR